MNKKNYAGLGGIALALLLVGVSLLPGKVQAAPGQKPSADITSPVSSTDSIVYLPIINNRYDASMPQLLSPENGAVLGTLIPVFNWDTRSQPANTVGCMTFGTSPNPTGWRMSYSTNNNYPIWEQVMWYNLEPSTIYYWRVGAIYNHDFDHPKWSEEWSFTTGPAGGTILAAPVLQSPANNSIISTPSTTLTWQALAEAVEYSVTLHELDTNEWLGFDGITGTQLVFSMSDFVTYGYGYHYDWYVEARNDYAWGNTSAIWKFTYSLSATISAGQLFSPDETMVLTRDGIEVSVIRR